MQAATPDHVRHHRSEARVDLTKVQLGDPVPKPRSAAQAPGGRGWFPSIPLLGSYVLSGGAGSSAGTNWRASPLLHQR